MEHMVEKSCNIKYLRRNTGLMRSYKKMTKILFVCHGSTPIKVQNP